MCVFFKLGSLPFTAVHILRKFSATTSYYFADATILDAFKKIESAHNLNAFEHWMIRQLKLGQKPQTP